MAEKYSWSDEKLKKLKWKYVPESYDLSYPDAKRMKKQFQEKGYSVKLVNKGRPRFGSIDDDDEFEVWIKKRVIK